MEVIAILIGCIYTCATEIRWWGVDTEGNETETTSNICHNTNSDAMKKLISTFWILTYWWFYINANISINFYQNI